MRAINVVEIELDRKRQIIFTHGALRRAETEINRSRGSRADEWLPIEQIITSAIRSGIFPADLTEILLWAGLLTEDPRLNISQVSAMIDDRIDCNMKLLEACNAYWPKPKEGDSPDGERPTKGTNGSTAGPSPESKLN